MPWISSSIATSARVTASASPLPTRGGRCAMPSCAPALPVLPPPWLGRGSGASGGWHCCCLIPSTSRSRSGARCGPARCRCRSTPCCRRTRSATSWPTAAPRRWSSPRRCSPPCGRCCPRWTRCGSSWWPSRTARPPPPQTRPVATSPRSSMAASRTNRRPRPHPTKWRSGSTPPVPPARRRVPVTCMAACKRRRRPMAPRCSASTPTT